MVVEWIWVINLTNRKCSEPLPIGGGFVYHGIPVHYFLNGCFTYHSTDAEVGRIPIGLFCIEGRSCVYSHVSEQLELNSNNEFGSK
jgi:hypothetical protein